MKVLFLVNDPTYFISHRMPIGVELLKQGYDVHIASPGECPAELNKAGFVYHEIKMSRKGKNVFSELMTIWLLVKLFKKIKPDLVHLVTIKPYLYGGIASRLARVPAVVSAVAGLGVLFSQNNFKMKALRFLLYPLYWYAFGHKNQTVIFQNTHDRDLLINWGVLDENKAVLIRGAGVDLKKYPFHPEPNDTPVITFASRMLLDKGVVEFVEASKILNNRGIKARFWLIGNPDPGNKNTVKQSQIDEWEHSGFIEYLGYRSNINDLFSQSNIITLPSYYGEGLPKTLIEAAACGRAVITTDHPGCRDAIDAGKTGILVPIKDSVALANAIEHLIVHTDERKSMAASGRALAEKEFSINTIVDIHIKIYQKLFYRLIQK